jgi:hypothetical protein
VIPPFQVPGGNDGFKFVVSALALSPSWDDALAALAPLAQSPVLGDALVAQHAQPTTFAERLEFGGSIHPVGMRYLVDSAWVDGPPGDIVAATKQLVAERGPCLL